MKKMKLKREEIGAIYIGEDFIEPKRPSSLSLSDYFKSCLSIVDKRTGKTSGEIILAAQVKAAASGSTQAAAFMFDRAYGKPVETFVVNNQKPTITVQHNIISIEDAKIEE
jgi:hypothetical protein